MKDVNAEVEVYNPWIDADEAEHEYGLRPIAAPQKGAYDAIVLAVAHKAFKELGPDQIRAFGKPDSVISDVKGVLPQGTADLRL